MANGFGKAILECKLKFGNGEEYFFSVWVRSRKPEDPKSYP